MTNLCSLGTKKMDVWYPRRFWWRGDAATDKKKHQRAYLSAFPTASRSGMCSLRMAKVFKFLHRLVLVHSRWIIAAHVMGILLCTEGYPYSDLSFTSISTTVTSLQSSYASVSTANEKFGHPIVQEVRRNGMRTLVNPRSHCLRLTLTQQSGLSCSPHIVSITHLSSVKDDASRPQVLISGEIHGDERVVRLKLHILHICDPSHSPVHTISLLGTWSNCSCYAAFSMERSVCYGCPGRQL